MMKNIPHRFFWIILFVAYTTAILYFCLREPGRETQSIPHFDKLLHILCYLFYAFSLKQMLRKDFTLIILFYTVTFGILVEYLQKQTGYRSFEYADMIANSFGAFLGVLLGQYQILKEKKFPQR